MKELWLRGDDRLRNGSRELLDLPLDGARLGVAPDLLRAIWKRACSEATESAGVLDRDEATRRFHELLSRFARAGLAHPVVGKRTRQDAEVGEPLQRVLPGLLTPVPGRDTHSNVEHKRWAKPSAEPHGREVPAASPSVDPRELTRATEVAQAVGPSSVPGRGAATRLDERVGIHVSQLFGRNVTGVPIVPDSPVATGATKALTQDGTVHFRKGAYRPGTPDGDRLIAHELAHVVQQRAGADARAGTRVELEREADRAASLISRGQPASINLRAQPGVAYAYSEGESHDTDVDAPDEHVAAPRAHEPAPAETPAQHAEPVPEPAGATDDHISTDEVADVSAPIPGEAASAAAPPAGGGPAAKPDKPAPNVASTKPEAGLAQMHGVRPDRLAQLFGPLHGANSADVTKERAAQHANPPKQMSIGAADASAATGKPGAPMPGGAAPPANANAADQPMPTKPVKGEVPGGEADKQAKQKQVAEQQQAKTKAVEQSKQRVLSVLEAVFGANRHAASPPAEDAKTQKMSDAESRNLAGSVDKLSTTASDISADPGPAPKLDMQGDAKTQTAEARAKLEGQTTQLEATGRADAQAPMGEDHIDPTAPPEPLTASFAGATADVKAAAMPRVAAAASSEEVGIVAQEQHGAEIDVALTKASGDVTAERAKHTAEQAAARAESDAQIHQLKAKADADQAAARASAQAEVHAARAQWQGEIDKKGADARKQADAKIADGMAQVTAEQTKANTEAQQHIADGQRKAEEEKQKGEKDAADAKDKAKHKSSGFFGWVASKARAAFDAVKKAVSSVIDACRKAVKAAIDAAKKLAMAAIELARKVIVAAVKMVGDALIAISNVLLAAFPALKAKFQAAIKGAVDKAVAAVNKLADGLKKAVQKALDLLGAALDKALGLLEKGIDAIIDAANAVVQGAIKAAQAVVQMLGTWAKLIKDIVTGPGAWLGKLGAAVVDGIKHHLWSAFKTAVVEWFKSKVFELLGVGGLILELLLEGGLTREHITQMAMDALMTAIPAALIVILVEKLVSMIVPAAGAVMAVIEGLQAAWGTVSRIIAAFSAFVGFLLAVKSGTAGPLFAGLLAAAAVVVLDFVANWLLKKLASAARKVGAKLKGLAERFKAKRKAKKDAKAGKHHDDHDGRKHQEHDEKNKHNEHDEKKHEDDKKQERLNKAVQELPPKITAALAKRPGKLMFKGKLLLWRTQYRLTALNVNTHGERLEIEAVVNPRAKLAEGYSYPAKQLYRMLRELGEEFLSQHPEILERAAARARQEGIDPEASKSNRAVAPRTTEEHFAVASDQRSGSSTRQGGDRTHIDHGQVDGGGRIGSTSEHPRRDTVSAGDAVVRGVNADGSASGYRDYETLRKDLAAKGVDGEMLGQAMRECLAGRPVPSFMQGAEKELGELMGLWFVTEPARDPRNATFSMMRVERMANDRLKLDTGIMKHPAEMDDHIQASLGLNANLDNTVHKGHLSKPKLRKRVKELRKRQLDDLKAWFQMQVAGGNVPVANDVAGLKAFIKERLELYFRMRE